MAGKIKYSNMKNIGILGAGKIGPIHVYPKNNRTQHPLLQTNLVMMKLKY